MSCIGGLYRRLMTLFHLPLFFCFFFVCQPSWVQIIFCVDVRTALRNIPGKQIDFVVMLVECDTETTRKYDKIIGFLLFQKWHFSLFLYILARAYQSLRLLQKALSHTFSLRIIYFNIMWMLNRSVVEVVVVTAVFEWKCNKCVCVWNARHVRIGEYPSHSCKQALKSSILSMRGKVYHETLTLYPNQILHNSPLHATQRFCD